MAREWIAPEARYLNPLLTGEQGVLPQFDLAAQKPQVPKKEKYYQLAIPELDFREEGVYADDGVMLSYRGAELHGVARRFKQTQIAGELEGSNNKAIEEFSYRSLEVGYLPDEKFWKTKVEQLDAMQEERERRLFREHPLKLVPLEKSKVVKLRRRKPQRQAGD